MVTKPTHPLLFIILTIIIEIIINEFVANMNELAKPTCKMAGVSVVCESHVLYTDASSICHQINHYPGGKYINCVNFPSNWFLPFALNIA